MPCAFVSSVILHLWKRCAAFSLWHPALYDGHFFLACLSQVWQLYIHFKMECGQVDYKRLTPD